MTERKVVLHKTHSEDGKRLFCDNYISTTKYSWWIFFPKCLFEQFSRIANFYFLVSACLMLFPWSPLDSSTSFLPLAIVVGISMMREGIEDLLRYKADKRENHRETRHLVNRNWESVLWKDVLVGDVVLVRSGEPIPADLVILSTSEEDGTCYIDTCNLDGETNLKLRRALSETLEIRTAADAADYQSEIGCDEPNNLLYVFNGYLKQGSDAIPLDNKQVALRGCVLKNTQWLIGVVVYTGVDSKLMMNSSKVRSKRSSIEKGLNKKLISVFAFLFALSVISGAIGASYEGNNLKVDKAWYTYKNTGRKGFHSFFVLLVSYFLLMNAMVPISLYVTLETVRVFQAVFIGVDSEMWYNDLKIGASARTSNLCEDLGLVDYIFSDKTGTLTRNVMELMKFSISGNKYGSGITEVAYAAAKRRGEQVEEPDRYGKAFKDVRFTQLLKNPPDDIKRFLWMLSVCNSVIAEQKADAPNGVVFQASSPDEAALVNAAADFGYVLTERGVDYATVKVQGKEQRIQVLAVLEFTSARKRSSVVIRSLETGKITLLCKGADDCILQRLAPGSEYRDVTLEHLKDFAADGLRTLCTAYREIEDSVFEEWAERYREANCALEKREERVEEVCDELERDLHLIGCTGIEDKLQIGVPETIEHLLLAGINVWIITGDKRETAINIGFACSLLRNDLTLVILDSENPDKIRETIQQGLQSTNKLALVASGASLSIALEDNMVDDFLALSQRCKSVICCRVSPYQKGRIVELIRTKTHKLTLAIGDGANDVGMILKADIGIGISGQEGQQAVMASDYSFGQFRFLERLLLFHGRLNLIRNVNLINYSFYKNMTFGLCQFLFGFFCGFSAKTVFDGYMQAMFNLVFTSIPPVIYAVFEKDVSTDLHKKYPEIYRLDGKKNWLISYANFWISLIVGIFHALIVFFVCYLGMSPYVSHKGEALGMAGFGQTVYACIVVVVNVNLGIKTLYWTWLMHLFLVVSILAWPLASILVDVTGLGTMIVGQSVPIMGTMVFWGSLFATNFLTAIPSLLYQIIANSMDTKTNRIMLLDHERAIARRLSVPEPEDLGDIGDGHIVGQYVDPDNLTGYQFAPPAHRDVISVPVRRRRASLGELQRRNQPKRTVTEYKFDGQFEQLD